MSLDSKDKFLVKQIADKGAKALYETYYSICRKNKNIVCDESIDYLKLFVNYPPEICIKIMREREYDWVSTKAWGEDYLDLLTWVAAYHLDRKETSVGILWAYKATELVDYFYPSLKREERQEIMQKMSAAEMIWAFPKQYEQDSYCRLQLDWETDAVDYAEYVPNTNDN